ncbi:MAG: hypothetical protein ABI134_03300 [Byssovorax sp.]
MDIADKIEFVQSTLGPMAWHTYPHIAGVVAMQDPQTGWHVGSALRLSLSGRRCIVTAAHVIEAARNHPPFGVTAVRGQIPYTLEGPPDRVDEALDVAAYFLPDDYPDEGLSFWPSERVDTTGEDLSSDYLFVHGFPGVRAQFSATPSGLVKKSLPYGVMLRDDDLPDDMASFEFAMDFDPANMVSADPAEALLLAPYGLSGSPVWRLGASGLKANAWKPELSMLVGFVTAWQEDKKLLRATLAAPVLEMLRRA